MWGLRPIYFFSSLSVYTHTNSQRIIKIIFHKKLNLYVNLRGICISKWWKLEMDTLTISNENQIFRIRGRNNKQKLKIFRIGNAPELMFTPVVFSWCLANTSNQYYQVLPLTKPISLMQTYSILRSCFTRIHIYTHT